jgi:hypothetical protein
MDGLNLLVSSSDSRAESDRVWRREELAKFIVRATLCAIAAGISIVPALAQQDIKSRVKFFCNDGVKLTERSIKFDVQKLISLDATQKASATLDSVSVVEISIMHLNCNLLVADLISPEQFLTKQTEILQFALEIENTRKIAESKVTPTRTDTNATPPGDTQKSGVEKTKATSPGDAKKSGVEKKEAATKTADLSIKSIAKDLLGVILKDKTSVGQSGNQDLVQSLIYRVISTYSPIPVSK